MSVYEDIGMYFGNDWDVIISCEVIEHLYDPRRFILNLKNAFKAWRIVNSYYSIPWIFKKPFAGSDRKDGPTLYCTLGLWTYQILVWQNYPGNIGRTRLYRSKIP